MLATEIQESTEHMLAVYVIYSRVNDSQQTNQLISDDQRESHEYN